MNSIQNKEQSTITGVDGLKSTEVAIAMQESFESKQIIEEVSKMTRDIRYACTTDGQMMTCLN